MKKGELFNNILELVAQETDLSQFEITSKSRIAEIVDARCLFVRLLSDVGFYPSDIAKRINLTQRAVNYILTDFDSRISTRKYLRNCYEKLKKHTSNNSFMG